MHTAAWRDWRAEQVDAGHFAFRLISRNFCRTDSLTLLTRNVNVRRLPNRRDSIRREGFCSKVKRQIGTTIPSYAVEILNISVCWPSDSQPRAPTSRTERGNFEWGLLMIDCFRALRYWFDNRISRWRPIFHDDEYTNMRNPLLDVSDERLFIDL